MKKFWKFITGKKYIEDLLKKIAERNLEISQLKEVNRKLQKEVDEINSVQGMKFSDEQLEEIRKERFLIEKLRVGNALKELENQEQEIKNENARINLVDVMKEEEEKVSYYGAE